jgi:hypothetical protein
MKTTRKIKKFVSSSLLIAGIGFAGLAQADWMYSQGNVAQIETPANTSTYKYMGWGLDLEEKPNCLVPQSSDLGQSKKCPVFVETIAG